MRPLPTRAAVCLSCCFLSACFVYVEGDEPHDEPHEEVVNSDPFVLSDGTWWFCEADWVEPDAYFEFQAVVDDPDGWEDVASVTVTLFAAATDQVVDGFGLNYEGDGTWGGFVWESESELYCGQPLDLVVEATDWYGGWDRLWILY